MLILCDICSKVGLTDVGEVQVSYHPIKVKDHYLLILVCFSSIELYSLRAVSLTIRRRDRLNIIRCLIVTGHVSIINITSIVITFVNVT